MNTIFNPDGNLNGNDDTQDTPTKFINKELPCLDFNYNEVGLNMVNPQRKSTMVNKMKEFSMDNYCLFTKYLLNNNLKFVHDINIGKDKNNKYNEDDKEKYNKDNHYNENDNLVGNNRIPSPFKLRAFRKDTFFVLNKNNYCQNFQELDYNLKQFYCLKVVLLRFSSFCN